jgi:hydrogenase nickel incorporation protein HypA/HybF
MHELSLMENILETLHRSADEHNIGHIKLIKLVIGKMTMVNPESLRFAFEALRPATIFSDAVLEVEEKVIMYHCRPCDRNYHIDETITLICPYCRGNEVEVISGREFYIDYYEGDGEDGSD